MAKKNERDPNLRAATVARVEQLVKGGLTKAAAFEKIGAETGRAKDAVQMLYYRAIRAAKGGAKSAARKTAKKAARGKVKVARSVKPVRRRRARAAGRPAVAQQGAFPALLNGIANSINALLQHVEKTVEENKTLRAQAARLQAISSLLRK